MLKPEIRKKHENAGYRIVGNGGHFACKVCKWTKESLREKEVCYKQKWYGIESHRCLQMTPSLSFCTHNCLFCWRFQDSTKPKADEKLDEPKDVIDKLIEAHRLLLTGFKGNEIVDNKKWKEAQQPTNVAISLAGEPCLYPQLSDLIDEFKKRKFSVFVVSNGTVPDTLANLDVKPTQLYITLPAPNEEIYLKTCRPLIKNGWQKINESLGILDSFDCKTVIRLTLVKGLNMVKPEEYGKIIDRTNLDFVEAKGYVHVGESQKRLPRDAMPLHEEIVEFSKKLDENSNFDIKDDFRPSRVVLLTKN